MELNREQIIKALECCTRGRKSNEDRPCLDCPYNECNLVGGTSERQIKGTCQGWLMKDALSLIKELTEENITISKLLVEKTVTVIEFDKQIDRLTEENEKLRKNLETFKGKQKSLQKQIEVLSKENRLLLSKDFDVTIGDCRIVFSNGKRGNIYTFTEKDQIEKEMLEDNT